jgi:hypothetical protein
MLIENYISEIWSQPVQRQVRSYNLAEEISIIEKIGKAKGSEFVIDNDNRFLFENIVKWANGDSFMCINPETKKTVEGDTTKGLFIAGNTGSGKTWAMEILSLYCGFREFVFKSHGNLKRLVFQNIRTDKVCEIYSETGLYSEFVEKETICFQDLTDEPSESLFMGNREQVVRRILSSRGDKTGLITHFTSNVPLMGLEKIYGDRVVSRMRKMCNYYELKSRDRRTQ